MTNYERWWQIYEGFKKATEHGNPSNFEILEQMKKSSIRMEYGSISEEKLPVGTSKIGGKPDLPRNFEWPYFVEDDGSRQSLSFLAQINCAEVKSLDRENLLPDMGMLYFFHELDSQRWGFSPSDKGSAKVCYVEASADIQSTGFPADLLEENQLPEFTIEFSLRTELPDFEEFQRWCGDYSYRDWDAYQAAVNGMLEISQEEADEDDSITKLLGYADLIQDEMLSECEEVTNGFEYGMARKKATDEELARMEEKCLRWQLLMQFDSIDEDGYELCFGDVGRLYFYIPIEDLKFKKFENCWAMMQCY